MATRSRIRRQIDFGRLRMALQGPNSDTRTWTALARVDDDPDARQYLPGFGWVVDVTITSGELAGEGPIPCRVMSLFGDPSQGTVCPVALGAEVVVLIPDGDANVQPIIMGYLHNPTDSPVPTSANDVPINEASASTTAFVRTEASLNAEFGPTVRVSAQTKASLEAPSIALAEENATQRFLRGDDFRSALDTFVNALMASGAYTSPSGAVTATPTLVTAATAFKNAVLAALSSRIRGE